MNTKDKVNLLIQLIRKYASKLSTISQMIPSDLRLKPEEKKILSNLNNTIKKFHKMIYNPTLNENIFENSDLEFENENPLYSNRRFNESKRKRMEEQFNNLIKKCENKVKILNIENENLKTNLKNFENIQKNYEQERTNYIRKITDNKKKYDELQKKFNQSDKLSKELQNKINKLEKEKKNKKESSKEKIKKESSKEKKILEIKEELNYKNSIIKYLEGLLKKTSINPKLFTKETYKKEYMKESNPNLNDINYYSEDRKSNEFGNNILNNQLISSLETENLVNLTEKKTNKIEDIDDEDLKENRPRQIKKEIDNLDQEIFELQSKLKKMLNK